MIVDIAETWRSLTSDEKIAAVRPLVEAPSKLSFRQVGARLGTTRNSIAGVISRSLLTPAPIKPANTLANQYPKNGARKARKKPGASMGDNFRGKRVAAKIKRHQGFNAFKPLNPAAAPVPVAHAWLPLPGSTPVPLEQHREGHCRWPIGDAPMLYCNEPAEGIYCPAHQQLGTRPLPDKKTNARNKAQR